MELFAGEDHIFILPVRTFLSMRTPPPPQFLDKMSHCLLLLLLVCLSGCWLFICLYLQESLHPLVRGRGDGGGGAGRGEGGSGGAGDGLRTGAAGRRPGQRQQPKQRRVILILKLITTTKVYDIHSLLGTEIKTNRKRKKFLFCNFFIQICTSQLPRF